MSCFLFLLIFLSSCKKEYPNYDAVNSQEVNKIETMYAVGMEKMETSLQPGETKIETFASDLIRESIISQIDHSNLKKMQGAKSGVLGDRVGVFRDQNHTCGSYDQLDITMDCEDRRNANGYGGWIGGNTVNSNVTLSFCLVPTSAFQSSKYYKYAVLDIYGGYQDRVERLFDNEDGSSINSVKLNGVSLTSLQIQTLLGGGIEQGNNTDLTFYIYNQDAVNGAVTFPNLSIPYGVVGYFNAGMGQGWIHTDDEDTNNANAEWYWWRLIDATNTNSPDYLYVQDLIKPTEGGKNTTIYMTKVHN